LGTVAHTSRIGLLLFSAPYVILYSVDTGQNLFLQLTALLLSTLDLQRTTLHGPALGPNSRFICALHRSELIEVVQRWDQHGECSIEGIPLPSPHASSAAGTAGFGGQAEPIRRIFFLVARFSGGEGMVPVAVTNRGSTPARSRPLPGLLSHRLRSRRHVRDGQRPTILDQSFRNRAGAVFFLGVIFLVV
jgi:hypothetical protein